MSDIDAIAAAAASQAQSAATPATKPAKPAEKPLTPVQQEAMAKLHDAATKFEGVFLQMVMSSMRDTVPKESIFGKDDAAGDTWQGMLDNEYSQAMAKSGGLGLAKQLEEQLKSSVLGNAEEESHAQVNGRIAP
jgi:flagellar protein FlgJ